MAILIDTDVIVARALTELVEAADGGRLVAFVNNPPNDERFSRSGARPQPRPASAPALPRRRTAAHASRAHVAGPRPVGRKPVEDRSPSHLDGPWDACRPVLLCRPGCLRRRRRQTTSTAPRAWPVHRLVSTERRAARPSRSPANRRYPAATSARSEALRRRAVSARRAASSTVNVKATRARAAACDQC